jgi:hypothetical protein
VANTPLRLATLFLFACTALPASAQVNVTFNGANGPNDLNLFLFNHDGTTFTPGTGAGQNFAHSPTAGVLDNTGGTAGGGLTTTNFDSQMNYVGPGGQANPTTFNLATGRTVSVMLNSAAWGTGRVGQLGFLNQVNNSFNNDPPANDNVAYIAVRPYGTGQLELQTKNAVVGAGTVNTNFVAGGTSLVNGSWYKLSFTATETSPGTFSATVALDNYGTAGTAFVSNQFTGTLNNIAITGFEAANGNPLGDGLAIAGFRQVVDNPNVDNFAIVPVPEPASVLGVCGLVAIIGGQIGRRRLNRKNA